MSQFFEDLFNSIFTPGPTPTLLIATNVSFAALQTVLFTLMITTYNVHFFVLSFLCGGLWAAINWFAREVQAAKELEDKVRRERKDARAADDSGTETEDAKDETKVVKSATLESHESLTKRRSLGESGTDSEWDKMESEVEASAEE
jgi:ER protein Pkr1